MFDDRHAATEAAIGLRQFEAHIAATQHDQMRRQIVKFEGLNIRERPGCSEAGNIGDGRMSSDIDEDSPLLLVWFLEFNSSCSHPSVDF